MGMFETAPQSRNVGVTLSINMPGGGAVKDPEKPAINGHSNGIDTLHARTDAPYFKNIDLVTLEPRGFASHNSLHPELVSEFSAAHAKSDPVTSDIFNFNLKLGRVGMYRIF
jgi:torulene dioxygenase